MILSLPGAPHLTYCTNIHAGETWPEVRANIVDKVAKVRDKVAPGKKFGVGLRLSARAAEELSQPEELAAFKTLLSELRMYVFTLNGFPYGTFHGTRVKESVYLPDWLTDERVVYTERLAVILAALLPDDMSRGSVSTVPAAFKSRVKSPADVEAMAKRINAVARSLSRLKAETGKTIVLALEPEPGCHLETTTETVQFFEDELFARAKDAADESILREHLGVCFDACHMAVQFESPKDALTRLAEAGIAIGKIQISAGLEVDWSVSGDVSRRLGAFAEDVYLHQVVAKRGDQPLAHFNDLPEALALRVKNGGAAAPKDELWRVHFHVPVFREALGPFANTQPYLRELLALVRARHITSHLEIETYTWDVLPEEHRKDGLLADVSREMQWVVRELGG